MYDTCMPVFFLVNPSRMQGLLYPEHVLKKGIRSTGLEKP